MLACSFCSTVQSPSWFSTPIPMAVVLAVIGGLVLGFVAVTRLRGRARLGVLVASLGLLVILPAASLAVRAGHTTVDVETTPPPVDASAWRVGCESALQADGAGTQLDQQFADACAEATSGWRWLAYALFGVTVALAVTGALIAMSSRRVVRRDAAVAE